MTVSAARIMHLGQPVLGVPDKRLLAGGTLVACGHVAVGIVVKTVIAADAVHGVVGTAIAVADLLADKVGYQRDELYPAAYRSLGSIPLRRHILFSSCHIDDSR